MNRSDNDAEKIYFSIFSRKIPSVIQNHFVAISKEIDKNYPANEVKEYYELVHNVHDLEALELAARHLRKLPVLTIKFSAMLYLGETVPGNYNDFVNEKGGCLSGYILLISAVFRSLCKFVKGYFILSTSRL